ncbi:major Facilitator Superfamily protein [Neorickettsia helminthoeca str. Oregon]|uniref:Major Facilitator Superfamily protein n=1 Tax=Neorickettsia helminthoeca str. Oregon TaxID=1286528 RepID=X5H4R7_9RICK|nr:MFS transporter [Neorickettsia helminthoeca]AHX11703.1 major Facilitator Superfamily protein [Neorickettsia helminthoeca str. Oregon]
MKKRKRLLLLNLCVKAVATFFLGFASNIPVVLVVPTLNTWLAKAGVNYSSIGVFSLITIPYIIKFLFAPFFDKYTVPLLGTRFGQKRGWIFLLQPFVVLSIIGLANTNPIDRIYLMGIFAMAVALFSSFQDIIIDSYRISMLRPKEQLIGSSSVLLGGRFAYLISGAVALFVVDYLCDVKGLCNNSINWKIVYIFSGFLSFSASIVVFFMGEPNPRKSEANNLTHEHELSFPLHMITVPLQEILWSKNGLWVVVLVIIYRSCDSLIATMISPFLVDTGFSLTEIAIVAKTFGLFSLVLGGFIGARIVYKSGIMMGLIVGGVVQMVSNVMFVVQAKVGYNLPLLYITIATENICGSIATTAILGYISEIASRARFSGTVYAVFSSISLIDRAILPIIAGTIADKFGWVILFNVSVVIGIPALALVFFLRKYSQEKI